MKKNTGFTMVELLAVITILGVLSLIAVGATTRFLTSSRKKTYEEFEDNMKTSTENYLIEHPEYIPLGSDSFRIDLTDLIDEQYSGVLEDPEKSGSACSGYVVVTKENSSNLKMLYQACLRCSRYESESCE